VARRTSRSQVELDLGISEQAPPEGTIRLIDVREKVFATEQATRKAIIAGRGGAAADPRHAAAEALARQLSRAVDLAMHKSPPDLYAVAQLSPRLLDVLRELRLTPDSEQKGSDLDELLASLGDPDE
jgi:hypothetical protein